MKITALILAACAIAFASCSSDAKKSTTDSDTLAHNGSVADTITSNTAPGHICFLHTEGTKNQDSSFVHLMIEGDKVTGDMRWKPFEKDGRNGKLSGTQTGNNIKVVWTFMQEGMTDTMALDFDFPGDKLKQKPLKFDTKTGRQVTDAKADYSVVFDKVDCK